MSHRSISGAAVQAAICVGCAVAGWGLGYGMKDRLPDPAQSPPLSAAAAEAALASLTRSLRGKSEMQRQHDFYDAVSGMSAAAVAAAIAETSRMTARDRDSLLPILVSRWAELDPAAAAAYALALPDLITRGAAARAAMNTWAAHDPDGAMQWISQLPRGKMQEHAIYGLASGLSKTDPDAAHRYMMSLPREAVSDNTFLVVFNEFVSKDPSAAARHNNLVAHHRQRGVVSAPPRAFEAAATIVFSRCLIRRPSIFVKPKAAPAFIPEAASDDRAVQSDLDFIHEILHPAARATRLGIFKIGVGVADPIPLQLARHQRRKCARLGGERVAHRQSPGDRWCRARDFTG